MSKKNKAKKNAKKTGKAKSNVELKAPRKGSLGDIGGYSVTAAIRALGVAGASCAHVRDIVKALGVKMSDHSIDVQVGLGRTKVRPPAPFTQEQLKELMATVPDPKADSAKPEKAPKKAQKPKASKKAKKIEVEKEPESVAA